MNPAPPEPGLIAAVRDFTSTVLRYLGARWSLIAFEGREAGAHLGMAALITALGVIFLFIGYLFLAVSLGVLIAWLCHAIGGIWVIIFFGTAFAHFAVALGAALAVKRRLRKPLFPATRAELRKDWK